MTLQERKCSQWKDSGNCITKNSLKLCSLEQISSGKVKSRKMRWVEYCRRHARDAKLIHSNSNRSVFGQPEIHLFGRYCWHQIIVSANPRI
jgi:hypothetical protein